MTEVNPRELVKDLYPGFTWIGYITVDTTPPGSSDFTSMECLVLQCQECVSLVFGESAKSHEHWHRRHPSPYM